MFLLNNMNEAYWNSYRLLESQLLRLSHSVCFDDNQVNVYSPELADIVNSACIKIESLAKDIYEDHIWPFQMDAGIIPPSYNGKQFKIEKWTRDNWKFDHNCLIEIDRRFALSKKRIELKAERFLFHKYGSTLLAHFPRKNSEAVFGNILSETRGRWTRISFKLLIGWRVIKQSSITTYKAFRSMVRSKMRLCLWLRFICWRFFIVVYHLANLK